MSDTPEFDDAFRDQLDTLIRWRRDVRDFRPDAVPETLLTRCLDTARLAPSVGLSEPWRFVPVDDEPTRARIIASFERCNEAALASFDGERAALYAQLKLAGLREAPRQLAVFADTGTSQGHGLGRATMPEMLDYSAVMAVHTFWLAARAHGLGVGWVSILDPVEVREACELPSTWRLIAYLCVGWPEFETDVPRLETDGWEKRREEQPR